MTRKKSPYTGSWMDTLPKPYGLGLPVPPAPKPRKLGSHDLDHWKRVADELAGQFKAKGNPQVFVVVKDQFKMDGEQVWAYNVLNKKLAKGYKILYTTKETK